MKNRAGRDPNSLPICSFSLLGEIGLRIVFVAVRKSWNATPVISLSLFSSDLFVFTVRIWQCHPSMYSTCRLAYHFLCSSFCLNLNFWLVPLSLCSASCVFRMLWSSPFWICAYVEYSAIPSSYHFHLSAALLVPFFFRTQFRVSLCLKSQAWIYCKTFVFLSCQDASAYWVQSCCVCNSGFSYG